MPNDDIPVDHTSLNDPGDATADRYRFQWTWAAIVCCMLFDETQDVVEVFCEYFEDVTLKHADGCYTGNQVKSRRSDQPIWKSDDGQVIASFTRFVVLEKDHPGKFRQFRFLTCHPVYAAQSAKSLSFVLKKIAEAATLGDVPRNVGAWVRKVAKAAGATEVVAFNALKKASVSDDLPKLQDCLMRLIDALTSSWPGATECSHDSIKRAAHQLVDECSKASSLDHLQTLPAYLMAISHPTAEIVARMNGKRMSKERIEGILNASLTSTAILAGDPNNLIEPGQGSTELMLKKLDAGGFSAVSCNSAEDLRDKADYLGIAWTKKQGKKKGLEQYEHVRSIALSDSARAFEATKNDVQKFGPAMRESLRKEFQKRKDKGEQLFDCSVEHLEGIAFSLTAQCKVQWSIDRPWENE